MQTIEVETPRGHLVRLHYRDETSDLATIGSTFRLWGKLEDEYHLADLQIAGTFVDIGAHVGSVVIAVLADNPEATGIAVEPLPENCKVIRASAESAGVADRLMIIEGAIGTGKAVEVGYDFDGDEYLQNHRFIGGMLAGLETARKRITVPVVTLAQLVKMAGGEIAAMKLDCEGCEWIAFRSKAVAKVRTIVGEWHDWAIDYQDSVSRLRSLLGATHDITVLDDYGGTGIFRAVAR